MKSSKKFILCVPLLLLGQIVLGQVAPPIPAAAASGTAAAGGVAPGAGSTDDLLKYFGIGLGITVDSGTRDRVDDAVVDVNGIVRVNKKSNTGVGLVLEAHPTVNVKHLTPFAAIQLGGNNQLIQAAGGGLMFAFGGGVFNIGIGWVDVPGVKVLGDEFQENKPAPVDSAGKPLPVRYQTKDKGSWLVIFSFGKKGSSTDLMAPK